MRYITSTLNLWNEQTRKGRYVLDIAYAINEIYHINYLIHPSTLYHSYLFKVYSTKDNLKNHWMYTQHAASLLPWHLYFEYWNVYSKYISDDVQT